MSICVEPHPDSHRFVIPVEWEYTTREFWDEGNRRSYPEPSSKQVTVLRCECGSEIAREFGRALPETIPNDKTTPSAKDSDVKL